MHYSQIYMVGPSQMKFRDNKIYQNRPHRDRRYLIQQQTDSYRDSERSYMEGIRQSLVNNQQVPFITISKERKSPDNESLAQRAQRYRRQIITDRHSVTQRSLNISKTSKPKKSSYQLSEEKAYPYESHRKNRLRLLTIQDKEKTIGSEIRHPPLKLSSLIDPLVMSNRKSIKQQVSTSVYPSNKKLPKYRLPEKDSQIVLNFTPKHKSLSKISIQAFNYRKIKKKEFMKGYILEEKLGKGGFSEVWSALELKTGKRFAVKEMNTSNRYQTHLAEIAFSSHFFENGQPKPKFLRHPGINVLLLMHSYSIQDQKAYVMYEKCDGALGQFLFEIFQETSMLEDDNQKKYLIMHKPLYEQMRKSTSFLKSLILQMAQALDLLQSNNIVHSDMKTSNILVKINQKSGVYNFKLIDYGSSFFFAHLQQYKLATPQYMPPQLLNYLHYRSGKQYNQVLLQYTQGYTNISAIDMWGLGCIVLQILHGIPIWLHNQVKIEKEGKIRWEYGLFATESRSYNQILQKQLSLTHNLQTFVKTENNTRIIFDNTLFTILKGLLTINPLNRMQPKQVIELLTSEDFQ